MFRHYLDPRPRAWRQTEFLLVTIEDLYQVPGDRDLGDLLQILDVALIVFDGNHVAVALYELFGGSPTGPRLAVVGQGIAIDDSEHTHSLQLGNELMPFGLGVLIEPGRTARSVGTRLRFPLVERAPPRVALQHLEGGRLRSRSAISHIISLHEFGALVKRTNLPRQVGGCQFTSSNWMHQTVAGPSSNRRPCRS